MSTPEAIARQKIDALLEEAGWCVQDYKSMNLLAAPGVAIREFPLKKGYGECDYLLVADTRPVGVVEAKPEGTTLKGGELQTSKYSLGLRLLDPWTRPLRAEPPSGGSVAAVDPARGVFGTAFRMIVPVRLIATGASG